MSALVVALKQESAVSEKARRVLSALLAARADAPERAVTDREIALRAGVAQREVIDLAEELVAIDVAVLATCGRKRAGTAGKGRFICLRPDWVRLYAEKLHKRAKSIHGRAAAYSSLAARLEAKRTTETTGQRRLFA